MLVDVRLRDFVLRAEAVLELVARAEIAQLGLHHRAKVAGRVVVELEHFAEVAVPEDDHSFAEIIGLHEIVNPFAESSARQTAVPASDIPEAIWADQERIRGSIFHHTFRARKGLFLIPIRPPLQ